MLDAQMINGLQTLAERFSPPLESPSPLGWTRKGTPGQEIACMGQVSMRVQISETSLPSFPPWLAEVAAFAPVLTTRRPSACNRARNAVVMLSQSTIIRATWLFPACCSYRSQPAPQDDPQPSNQATRKKRLAVDRLAI